MNARHLLEMDDIRVSFGGVHAVDGISIDLDAGEVLGLLGHNGAGKSTLIKVLAGVQRPDSGRILIDGEAIAITNPRDARTHRIETIHQNLALADNLDACANLFLGREITTGMGLLDEAMMEQATRAVMARLNPHFNAFHATVASLSGGERQAVAIARAVHFDARILIMDEPTASLGVAETKRVAELISQLKKEGLGILLVSHDIHDLFDLADRLSVMKNGKLVGTVRTADVTQDDVLAMIILGRMPG
jgi:D-xylose transport system ATP-binding protein